jgi:hypothetical protein
VVCPWPFGAVVTAAAWYFRKDARQGQTVLGLPWFVDTVAYTQKHLGPLSEGLKGDVPMSKALRYTFLVHTVVAVVFSLLLLIIPGKFLDVIGWQGMLQELGWENTDPFASRLLGAAMLGLAWSSFRGWQATAWTQVAILVEMEAVFTVLSCAGLLRHLIPRAIDPGWFPAIGWLVFAGFAVFAIAWIYFLVKREAREPALA